MSKWRDTPLVVQCVLSLCGGLERTQGLEIYSSKTIFESI